LVYPLHAHAEHVGDLGEADEVHAGPSVPLTRSRETLYP
jgi:hypothetical protein